MMLKTQSGFPSVCSVRDRTVIDLANHTLLITKDGAERLVPVEDVSYLVFHGSHDGDVTTFHGLGLRILREQHEAVGLGPGFRVADDTERLELLGELLQQLLQPARLQVGQDLAGRGLAPLPLHP